MQPEPFSEITCAEMVGGLRGDSSGDAHRNLNQLRKPFSTLIVSKDLREGLSCHTASGLLKKADLSLFFLHLSGQLDMAWLASKNNQLFVIFCVTVP